MTHNVLKIALTGAMRSGKDEVGYRLYMAHNFAMPIAFGDALKRIAHEAFPDVPRDPKPRALYQFMNVFRDYDPDVWIKHAASAVKFAESWRDTKGIVITDVRQRNEYDWCRANGFTIVRVKAQTGVRIARAHAVGDKFDYEALTHPTEMETDSFEVDYEITNDGSLDELYAQVDALFAQLTSPSDIS